MYQLCERRMDECRQQETRASETITPKDMSINSVGEMPRLPLITCQPKRIRANLGWLITQTKSWLVFSPQLQPVPTWLGGKWDEAKIRLEVVEMINSGTVLPRA